MCAHLSVVDVGSDGDRRGEHNAQEIIPDQGSHQTVEHQPLGLDSRPPYDQQGENVADLPASREKDRERERDGHIIMGGR